MKSDLTAGAVLRAPLDSPAAWRGDRMATRPGDWQVRLTDQDLDELTALAARLARGSRPLHHIPVEELRLPRLAVKAVGWRRHLEGGPGVLLVRGMPVAGQSQERLELMYWALSSAIGVPTPQDKRELYLAHVREDGPARPDRFAYQTNVELPFHTDWCDIVSLLCVGRSRSGGASRVASSVAVYNELLRRRPDLVDGLYEPFWMNNKDEADGDRVPYYAASHISWLDGRLSFRRRPSWRRRAAANGQPAYLQPSGDEAPPEPSAQQQDALELMDAIAGEPGIALSMDLVPGDVQYVNNHTVLHARDGFENGTGPDEQRHLMRMWLTVPDGRRLSDTYARGIARQYALPQPPAAAAHAHD
ncbi:TauD/TfdA family dioxygenase [Streptomyces sp. NPDC007971]|uniref:TauD/TfdA family dioxygenase n=1 Tax=Streptomyces sp. NPDC007971 TaxID=3364799 RepID=UPI0036E1B67D